MAYTKRLIPIAQTGKYPAVLSDYLDGKLAGHQLYQHEPNINGLAQAMGARLQAAGKPRLGRDTLVNVLTEQYSSIELSGNERYNIALLRKPTTFCVTTGHQLNLFSGPLYVPFKLMSAINLCRQLKERYPTHDFVPIYWMATEDHDKDEVDHFNMFGKKYQWHTDQTGPVGRFAWPPAEEFWQSLPQDIPADAIDAYRNATTWADATRELFHHWFGHLGLICLDPDDLRLKQAFVPIALQDAIESATKPAHDAGSARFETSGHKPQVNARPINLFYMGEVDGRMVRERLVREGDQWLVLNTDLSFDEEALRSHITDHPDYWSPNVVLRPLYQEAILPNIAYLGGPAEVAYWLQTADLFTLYKLPMPVVLPRALGQINTKAVLSRLQKANLRFEDLLLSSSQLKALILARQAGSGQVTMHHEYQLINQAFVTMRSKANAADPTLSSFVDAQEATVLKTLENVEKRISKAMEKRHETLITQALNLRDKVFPNDGLQERSENILAYLINNPGLWDELTAQLDPLAFALHVFDEQDQPIA
jgi:bacillithiol biosynthesis cysteine-adding enzyme BshC